MVSPYLGNTYRLRGGGNGGVSASGATRGAVLGRAPPPTTHVTHRLRITRRLRAICRLRHRNFSIPTKETIPVYAHLGTHATSAVDFPKWKIVTTTYECTEPSSAVFPLMALYITCSSGAPSVTIASSREPLKNQTQGKVIRYSL